jgi:tRNA modification GTPase
MVTLLASLWATIDYPEEDLAELSNAELCEKLEALETKISRLTATYRTGRAIQEGLNTVIVGKPNVGKSSLYNLLCCEDAAIVTDIAGTTRDLLTRTVALGDVTLRLTDTAGLRDTDDVVEQIGVSRTRESMENADLILAVFDGSSPLGEEDLDLLASLNGMDGIKIAIINKADLPLCDMQAVKDAIPHALLISAKDGDTTALASLVKDLFTDGTLTIGDSAIVWGARQYASLTQAQTLIHSTLSALRSGLAADVACSDLELALGELGAIDGRAVAEDVVSAIFSHFCVGK